jgi:hypothetical protein
MTPTNFRIFCDYFPFEEAWAFSAQITQGSFISSLIEIGLLVLGKKT